MEEIEELLNAIQANCREYTNPVIALTNIYYDIERYRKQQFSEPQNKF